MAIVKNSGGDRLGVVTYDQEDERIHFAWRCKDAATWTRELIDNTADLEWTMWGSPSMVVDRNNEKINVAYLQMDLEENIAKVRWAQRDFPTCN